MWSQSNSEHTASSPSAVSQLHSKIVVQIMMKPIIYAFSCCAIMMTALPIGVAIAVTSAQEELIPTSVALRGKWPYVTNM